MGFNATEMVNRVINANPNHSADLDKYTSPYKEEYHE